ncbi:coiled-coil domain-containing protein 154 [Rhinolophus ferrumequinum]|uniref:coiled-coil domain-containing protein 154 n=1 Tax=Rhinolophus ferrumequinum TaxID=59479 RepID=UPI00140F822D|nr:coiled-coil domain-containing protein 154 [Rhinolophus ferrumequinum]
MEQSSSRNSGATGGAGVWDGALRRAGAGGQHPSVDAPGRGPHTIPRGLWSWVQGWLYPVRLEIPAFLLGAPSPTPNYPGVQLWGSHGVLGLGLLGSDQGQRLLVKPCQESQLSTLEDLELLLEEGLDSPEPLSLEEISERYETSRLASTISVPEQDTPQRWKQLEQWVADLQTEVASLRGHKDNCERATLSLLQELRQVRAHMQLQDSELRKLQQELQQAAWAPEKEAREFPRPQTQNQMQALDKRLVEVREALTQIRRKQALQDSERKSTEQEANFRLAKLAGMLEQEEQDREVAICNLQRSQEEASQRMDHEVARMQAQVTKLGEEMSLRFLKREAKLCGFLQKSFLAVEKVGACGIPGALPAPVCLAHHNLGDLSQRMKTSESMRLKAESSLREELESRWQKLQELAEERVQALRGQCKQEESHLLEQCWDLDRAVVQLTKFVQQNQMSLNRVLLAEQKARDTKGHLEESQAGELAAFLQENLKAVQLAGELALQEMRAALELLQEKSQALEVSVDALVRQVKDLSDHFLALSWRLDLQEHTLTQRLCEAKSEWEGTEQRSLEGLAQCRKEAQAHLREVQETVDNLPRQIEAVSDKCVLHKSDSDLKISAEGKAREFEVGAMRQELAALVSSMQQLRECNPGRKIAELQGKLVTQFFVKDVAPGEVVPVNRWGRVSGYEVSSGELPSGDPSGWLQWKAVLMNRVAQWRPKAVLEKSPGQEPALQLMSLPLSQK